MVKMVHKRKMFKFEVRYLEKSPLTFGLKKTIYNPKTEYATSKEDAREWESLLKRTKGVKNVRVVPLKKKEWF